MFSKQPDLECLTGMLAHDRECKSGANGSVAPLCISPDYTMFSLSGYIYYLFRMEVIFH